MVKPLPGLTVTVPLAYPPFAPLPPLVPSMVSAPPLPPLARHAWIVMRVTPVGTVQVVLLLNVWVVEEPEAAIVWATPSTYAAALAPHAITRWCQLVSAGKPLAQVAATPFLFRSIWLTVQ